MINVDLAATAFHQSLTLLDTVIKVLDLRQHSTLKWE